jgi:predicted phosphodiesterase
MKILILSDIHGNWAALQSVLAAEADFDKILCLGDLVDYGEMSAKTAAALAARAAHAMSTITAVAWA